MKVLALHTYTDCENKLRSLEAVGFDVVRVQYDDRPHDRHHELVEQARQVQPNLIVYIGAVEAFHGRPVPRPDTFQRLRDVAPTVHMCNDAADPPWWPTLEQYHREYCFDLQVSIDGSVDNPIAGFKNGLLALTPVDHRPYAPRPWLERDVRCLMIGGDGPPGSRRHQIVHELVGRGQLDYRGDARNGARPVDRYAEEYCAAQCAINFPWTGSGAATHVKGRVVEAGLAGCCLLEHEDNTRLLDHWFVSGSEYMTYGSVDKVVEHLRREPTQLAAIASQFHRRVVAEHHPSVFWNRVLDRLGMEEHRAV